MVASTMNPLFVPELVDYITDFLFDDFRALCHCSLVCKQLLPSARYHLFNHITLKLCEPHSLWVPQRCRVECKHCFSQFAELVASPTTTIPVSICSLKLTGKDFHARWTNFWSIVGNAGGMERPEVILAVMKHFQSVERLEMIELHWFNPPWYSSRTVARFFSSVKSLTLDNVGFYAGPRALIQMLDSMSSLEVLLVHRATWPAQNGIPNNASALLITGYNIAAYCAILGVPIYKLSAGVLAVTERLRRPVSRYALHTSLRRLVITLSWGLDNPWLLWLLTQDHALSSVISLVVTTRCIIDKEEVELFERLLAAVDSLRHLKLLADFSYTDIPAPMPSPTFIKQQALESLDIRFRSGNNAQRLWIPWLWDILHAAPHSCLTVIRIVLELKVDDPEAGLAFRRVSGRASGVIQSSDVELGDIDDYLCSFPDLRQLCFSTESSDLQYNKLRVTEGIIEQWVKRAFWRCDAMNILSVKVEDFRCYESWY